MIYIILSSYTKSCEALYDILLEWLMEITIGFLFNDHHKMVFPHSHKAFQWFRIWGSYRLLGSLYSIIVASWVLSNEHTNIACAIRDYKHNQAIIWVLVALAI